jgi:hypothetical protein
MAQRLGVHLLIIDLRKRRRRARCIDLCNASKEAATPEEFCERLAAHVSAPAERAAFVQAVQARLAEKA